MRVFLFQIVNFLWDFLFVCPGVCRNNCVSMTAPDMWPRAAPIWRWRLGPRVFPCPLDGNPCPLLAPAVQQPWRATDLDHWKAVWELYQSYSLWLPWQPLFVKFKVKRPNHFISTSIWLRNLVLTPLERSLWAPLKLVIWVAMATFLVGAKVTARGKPLNNSI